MNTFYLSKVTVVKPGGGVYLTSRTARLPAKRQFKTLAKALNALAKAPLLSAKRTQILVTIV